ncbi:hypothetical protein GUITHDRAFT_122215, partial [Guillardia theta CCMP2712]
GDEIEIARASKLVDQAWLRTREAELKKAEDTGDEIEIAEALFSVRVAELKEAEDTGDEIEIARASKLVNQAWLSLSSRKREA